MLTSIKNKFLMIIAFGAVLTLTACGGGGSGGGGLFDSNEGRARIELSAGTYQLPVQTGAFVEPIDPRYTTQIIAKAYGSDGDEVPSGTPIDFVIDGGNTFSGALYPQPFEFEEITNPDGTTSNIKKAFWNYSVTSTGGQALILFHAWNLPGTVKISASFKDPVTGRTISKSMNIEVVSAIATGMPANIYATITNGPIYVANQGKTDTAVIDIQVTDPLGQTISNPSSANIKVELLNPEIGATLIGTSGQQGSIVNTKTINGKANIALKAGNTAGTARLRITADAADNNVENGIQQAIIDDVSISISDGRVAAISLTGPFVEAGRTNRITLPLSPEESFQDGTYLRVLSAVATDNLGNPVVDTEIRFSLIDSPIEGYPSGTPRFTISGTDGNPSEGGNLFTANSGQFNTRGVFRNDRLILHPDEQGPDRLLAGSRIISLVNSATSLLVNAPFSHNNGFDDGPVIPWTIGRAKYGVIGSVARTNEQGVATTFITYPSVRLNQPALITAEADNGISTVALVSYLGMGRFNMISSHTEVRAGTRTDVTLCVKDENSAPVPAQQIDVNGVTGNITVSPSPSITGGDGCAQITIDASQYSGLVDIPLSFSIPGTSTSVTITVKSQGSGTLYVTSVSPGGNNATIDLVLLDDVGNPIAGRLITATGTANDDVNGTRAVITNITSDTTDNLGKAAIGVEYEGDPGDTYTITITAQGGATNSVTVVHP